MPEIVAVLKNPRCILGLYVVMTIGASIAKYLRGGAFFDHTAYTHINNFLIIKTAFFNLISNQDLYALHLDKYWDFYKYSPTFALLMAPIAVMPDVLGLIVWNVLNALALYVAIAALPVHSPDTKSAMHWFLLLPLLTSVQNAQSNGLVAALLLGAFNCFEKKNVLLASLCIVLSFYIKLFGIVACILSLLYQAQWKCLAYTLLWLALLFVLPLVVIAPEQLGFLYSSWANLLLNDHTASLGSSVFGFLRAWFHIGISKELLLLAGIILLCLPFVRRSAYVERHFRLLFVASLAIWVVIFNHKAESASFVIAMSGVAIWYFAHTPHLGATLLVGAAFVLTSLAPTDVFPKYVRHQYINPYAVEVVPCLVIWLYLQYQLLVKKDDDTARYDTAAFPG